MATGTVKWFNGTKGYGFVAPDDGDADIFIHISQVQQSGLNELQDNQKYLLMLKKVATVKTKLQTSN